MKGTLPIRLPSDIDEELSRIAQENGVTKSSLVRLLVSTFVQRLREKNSPTLPAVWREILDNADGRSIQQVAEGKGIYQAGRDLTVKKKKPPKSKSTSTSPRKKRSKP